MLDLVIRGWVFFFENIGDGKMALGRQRVRTGHLLRGCVHMYHICASKGGLDSRNCYNRGVVSFCIQLDILVSCNLSSTIQSSFIGSSAT